MTSETDTSRDDPRADLLAAYHELLTADGAASPEGDTSPLPGELERAGACLRRLEQERRRRQALACPRVSPVPPADSVGGGRVGRFQVVRELGRGGYGIVFLARDPQLGRLVALKVPQPGVLLRQDLCRRLRHEAQAAATLDHPNVVPVYETGEVGPAWYIASAYCPGLTLADWLARQTGPVPPRSAAALLATLAEAVAYTHDRGVLHRDLKPGNVLLTPAGAAPEGVPPEQLAMRPLDSFVARLTDFGLARFLEQEGGQTGSGFLLGTAAYMAPEQAAGRPQDVGRPADVYALGVILYELLVGRPPFVGDTPLATLDQVRTREPVPPRRLCPELPGDLAALCLKCLHKEPDRRYASASALAEDLRRFLAREPTPARPVGRGRLLLRRVRRRPGLAAAGLLVALGLLAGGLNYGLSAKRKERQQQEYVRNIRSVPIAAQEGRFADLYQRLEDQRRDLRGFEWHYLWWRHHPRCEVLASSPSPIYAAALSRDVRFLAVGGGDQNRTIRVWNLATRELRHTLVGHRFPVLSLAFDQSGQRLASAGGAREPRNAGEVKVWELATGNLRMESAQPVPVECVSFSGTGHWLVTALAPGAAANGSGLLRLWNNDEKYTFYNEVVAPSRHPKEVGWVRALAVGQDGINVMTVGCDDGALRVLDLKTLTWATEGIWDFPAGIRALTYSPVKHWIAFGLMDGSQPFLGARPRGAHQAGPPLLSIAVSPDEAVVAGGGPGGTVRLWDEASGIVFHTFPAHPGAVRFVAFTPDGRTLISAGEDGTVKLWDRSRLNAFRPLAGQGKPVWTVACSLDGRTLASAGEDHDIKLWDACGQVRQTLKGHKSPVTCLAFSANGELLASGSSDHTVRLWSLRNGTALACLEGHTEHIGSLAFHPHQPLLASGDQGGVIRLWDADAEKRRWKGQRVLRGHTLLVSALAFSPDGKVLASGSEDTRIGLWDWTTGTVLRYLVDGGKVRCLAFAPDGQALVSGNLEGVLGWWDPATERERWHRQPSQGSVRSVAFAPDGRTVASAGEDDGGVRLWQAATGEELLVLRGHKERVNALAFAPDGRRLVSGAQDGSIYLWSGAEDADGDRASPGR